MSAIILFDGECNLCDNSVQFIMKRDPAKYFQFASLQGEAGNRLIQAYRIQQVTSVVLIDNGRAYTGSGAALRISRHLHGPWKLFYVLLLIPRPLRDYVYSIIANNRYKWFGKKTSCMLPTPEMKDRFLE